MKVLINQSKYKYIFRSYRILLITLLLKFKKLNHSIFYDDQIQNNEKNKTIKLDNLFNEILKEI